MFRDTEKEENIQLPNFFREVFPVFTTDHKQNITFANQKFCQLVQFEEDELIGNHISIVQLNVREQQLKSNNSAANPPYVREELEYLTKNKEILWGFTTKIYVYDESDVHSHSVCIITDLNQSRIHRLQHVHSIEYLRTLEMAINESNAVIVTSVDGKILSVNKHYCELSQYTEKELINKSPGILSSGAQPKEFYQKMWKTILKGEIWTGVLKNRAKDGSTFWVNSTIVPVKNKLGDPTQFIAIQTEITARIKAEKSLQRALKNDFEKTVRNVHNIVFKYAERDGEIVFTLLAGKMLKTLDLTLSKITIESLKKYYKEFEYDHIEKSLRKALTGKPTQFEINYENFTLLLYLSPIFKGNEVMEVVGTVVDITNRKNAENLARKMAYYDFLTELPNRRYLQENTEKILFKHATEGETCSLIFIDIDRFKNINDSMGHAAGDELLIHFARRLESIVSEKDIVARLGGDEFIILLPYASEKESRETVEYIVQELKNPFAYRNLELFITPSIGISMFPKDGADYNTLLGSADIAMYKNKKEGNRSYQFFTKELKQNILERTLLEMDLRQAIDKRQFHLIYQPIYNLNRKEIVGVEALIRWKHPEKGMVSPAYFIPLAEETGMIVPIGKWVVKEACRQMKNWHDAGFQPISMAVNISIAQFSHPLFVQQIKEVLDDVGLAAKYLNLEVTESMMLDKQQSLETFHQLRNLGTPISVDDFGTGYSSLSYLSDFPITHLKIDQTFIHNFTDTNQAIVETIINLAKSLQVRVIAEGVEEPKQEMFLRQLGCDEVQGYLYAKPISASEIEQMLSKQIYQL